MEVDVGMSRSHREPGLMYVENIRPAYPNSGLVGHVQALSVVGSSSLRWTVSGSRLSVISSYNTDHLYALPF